ncbi:cupin domain-containing protein [Actinomadura sp. NTSP31]|uniref:cupin domain-containing protein n=1 Tax=Actinomadura sp. NTSP31 TaxID=1735447 RepID=UPI0035C25492
MTRMEPGAVVVRGNEAETIGDVPAAVRLLADSSSTGGALSTQRVTLAPGGNGATPHYHAGSTELFYMLGGTAQILSGEQVLEAGEGDLVVVPPGLAHAFAAKPGSTADLLIVITPGVERFDYFRLLGRLGKGEATLDELLESQERFDNHFLDSPEWTKARS